MRKKTRKLIFGVSVVTVSLMAALDRPGAAPPDTQTQQRAAGIHEAATPSPLFDYGPIEDVALRLSASLIEDLDLLPEDVE